MISTIGEKLRPQVLAVNVRPKTAAQIILLLDSVTIAWQLDSSLQMHEGIARQQLTEGYGRLENKDALSLAVFFASRRKVDFCVQAQNIAAVQAMIDGALDAHRDVADASRPGTPARALRRTERDRELPLVTRTEAAFV